MWILLPDPSFRPLALTGPTSSRTMHRDRLSTLRLKVLTRARLRAKFPSRTFQAFSLGRVPFFAAG
jgi:hypothetical protein